MKKQLFSLLAVAMIGFTACNSGNNDTTGTNTDTSSATGSAATGTETSTVSSSGDYAAMADEFERNSQAGKYRDARTGQPLRISVDRSTGAKMNAETNEPITRYIMVDNTDWWAYDNNGSRLGRARYENNKVMYEGDNNNWVDYDVKWKTDGDGESKMKTDGLKIKTEKDGDMKIKTDDKKIKIEDGKVKEKDN
jgi:hypothetical protein